MMYDDWDLLSEAVYVFMYFDIFYIQWHHLAKKDLWNKVHMNEWMSEWMKQQTLPCYEHLHIDPTKFHKI
jgi:hypothetical protein